MIDNERPDVGSLAEEAARLVAALQGWASASGTERTGSASAGVGALLRELDEHIATGGQDCRYCPLCQVIAAVRTTSPEVRRHLSTAVSSLLQAAAEALATREDGRPTPRSGAGVERIDLSDGDEWEGED